MNAAAVAVDRDRLVDTASRDVGVRSFTGREQAMAELMRGLHDEHRPACASGSRSRMAARTRSGPGRARAAARASCSTATWTRRTRAGSRGSATCPASSPRPSSEDGRLYGLGISNMKGALACYVEAVRALQDAGVRLRGDVLIAAVCGEIEKTQ